MQQKKLAAVDKHRQRINGLPTAPAAGRKKCRPGRMSGIFPTLTIHYLKMFLISFGISIMPLAVPLMVPKS